MGQYAHGNQPIQHMIYLYNYAGQPWKTQYWVREVMNRLYLPTPDGYCGDEDNGQTSAWYVFSALGFYPVCPTTDQYVLGAPLFPKATLHLPSRTQKLGREPVRERPDRQRQAVRQGLAQPRRAAARRDARFRHERRAQQEPGRESGGCAVFFLQAQVGRGFPARCVGRWC